MMKSYLATKKRTGAKVLETEIEIVGRSSVVTGLLETTRGLLAVLDQNRQVVALNDAFLKELGIADPFQALGLRIGEILNCVHAGEAPAGCGTTKFCATCGAAIAIVASQGQNAPVEKTCALTVLKDGREKTIALLAKSHPLKIKDQVYLLLFLQDMTKEQRRAALERTFFHDVNNLLSMLVGSSELLVESEPSHLATAIHRAARRLHREVSIQSELLESTEVEYEPVWTETTPGRVFSELASFFENHPAARDKHLDFPEKGPEVRLRTDTSLLSRVISNMILNALEASAEQDHVRVWAEQEETGISFLVWNHQVIQPSVTHRIFQRNFSTKNQAGRGYGTYSMKLFGEDILGGKVDFTTSLSDGTRFRLSLPR